jgi:Xaa-Pro aminopeptidase
MGGEYHCYASDITTTVPISGKFSEQQKKIYNAVLEANRNVFNAVKPGMKTHFDNRHLSICVV